MRINKKEVSMAHAFEILGTGGMMITRETIGTEEITETEGMIERTEIGTHTVVFGDFDSYSLCM